MSKTLNTLRGPAALACGLLLAGCGKKNEFVPPPPPPVTVANPEVRDVTVYRTYPGTLEGVAEVEIRAQVRGILRECRFQDGQVVAKDAPLYLIDPDPFQAAVTAAEGRLAEAEAAKELAIANLARLEKAFETKAVSESQVDIARAETDQTAAAATQAKAALDNAGIDLSYTDIKAPVAGRLSRNLVDVGNLVDGAQGTLLTTIIDDTSIRAYFELNERVILPYLNKRPKEGAEKLELREDLKLQLELTDGSIYGHPGALDFIDNQIDEKTRTIRVRAEFPNPDGNLAAGMFARIGIPFAVKQAVLVPTAAILRDLAGDYVWVVDGNNVVRRRGVEAGPSIDRQRIISEGLEGADRVIVAGLQRAREGATVDPQTADPEPADEGTAPKDQADQPEGPESEAGE